MRTHVFSALCTVVAALVVVAPTAGQNPATGDAGWVTPRTAGGHPDLQGVWGNNSATPLERPEALQGKEQLTNEELARLRAKADELFDPSSGDAAFGDSVFAATLSEVEQFSSADTQTGNYNQFWMVERDWDSRTSLIIDPPNGRLPSTTPAAMKYAKSRAAARGRPAAWTDDRGLSERCITFGLPNLLAGYNSYYQIIQTDDHVVIQQELIHTTRIIPLEDRPHVRDEIRQWHGDARGHWEGDTLVVETTNFSQNSDFRGSREYRHLVVRFTRVGPDTLHYEFTVNDPTVWTTPWTAAVPWKRTDDAIYEYACHEGNIGMHGILAGARTEELAANPPR